MLLVHQVVSSTVTSTETSKPTTTTTTTTTTRKQWNVALLETSCDDQITSTRICDPDYILSTEDTSKLAMSLHALESNHPLTCNSNINEKVDVQMAVTIINEMLLSKQNNFYDDNYMIQQGKKIATSLHNHWGVGHTQCNGSGILLLLSIQDRIVYISTSKGLQQIITQQRIDHIIDEVMKPRLKEEAYSEAIIGAVQAIQKYMDQGPPSFFERHALMIIMSAFFALFGGFHFHQRKKKKEYALVHSHLSRIDRSSALALMGKYQCTSCPICLEDFQMNVDIDCADDGQQHKERGALLPTAKEQYIGSDGKPIQVLKCGHAFDASCWEAWISNTSRNIHQCPICKEDIGISPSVSAPIQSSLAGQQPLVDQSQFNGLRNRNRYYPTIGGISMYQPERNFRLQRLSSHYPRFINQSQVNRWTTDDYQGSLVQDADFVRSDPRVEMNGSGSESAGGRSSSFNSFGGGSSGGGGGGRW